MDAKQLTLEEAAEHHWKMTCIMSLDESTKPYIINDFKAGAEWQAKRMYSEEDMELSHKMGAIFAYGRKEATHVDRELHFKGWFEQFKNKKQNP